jgi:apolipoprotein N-acyltransferase
MPTESFAARLLAALLLGAASVLAFAPVGVFPLVWLTLAGLFALLARSSVIPAGATRRGALLGGAFGFGLFIAGVSWVYVSLSTFGGMFPPVAALGTLLFCAVLSLFPAFAGALFARFMPAAGWRRVLFFAALWTLGEWLRGWVLTGFPWLVVGYAQAPPSPLAGFAPLFGVYGVSLLSALLGALIGEVGLRWMTPGAGRSEYTTRWRRLLPLLAVPLLLASGQLLYGVRWTQPLATPLSVSLLQGNVAQDLKWRPESFIDSLRTYYRLAQDNPAQLTVMPETALPAFLDQVPDEYLDELKKLAAREHGDMLFGIVVGNMGRYANAAVSLGQSGEQRYSKSHLVPFGEFVPPGFAWFLALAKIPMSDFMPGPPGQPPLAIAGQTVAVDICYEDAFGEEIIRALPQATLLVNISNVAWFGDSLAPAQHLQIAQLRALESGRMMLRSTNTGMTAIIAADGQVLSSLKPFTRGALRGVVHGYQGLTPYARWGNSVVVAVMLLLIVLLRRRQTPD